jgi:hypothetical protein
MFQLTDSEMKMSPGIFDHVNHVLMGNKIVSAKLHKNQGETGNSASAAHYHESKPIMAMITS